MVKETARRFTEDKSIEVTATEDIIAGRVNKPRENSEADFDAYLKVKEQFEPLDKEHLVLNSTNDNIESMLQEAQNYLNIK